MKKPNWQTKFRNLPEIPSHKKWDKQTHFTREQLISFKLLTKVEVTSEEESILHDLFEFYDILDEKLQTLNYQSFTQDDLENFKNYIFYAFNYVPLISNKITIFHTYRLVVNEIVSKNNSSLNHIKFLKQPDLSIVKKINKYNRANTPNTNVLYTAENIDTALKELKPPKNKLITVGLWLPKEKKELISYPISHSENAIKINSGVEKATRAIETYGLYNSQLLIELTKKYFNVLGREYTKPVNHHYEYLISSLFSERILANRDEPDPSFRFDCIIYPSVGNSFQSDNLAIHPDVVEKELQLSRIIEFEIEESYYERNYSLGSPENITLAKVKNLKYAKGIAFDGNIRW